jgi:MinD-like ATPase involved in chromosome partitioning or flagellar assembly
MSVIALASAKGSPGVTTAALALAAVWSRRVLVAECDPAGGDLACWFGLPSTPGLLSLAPAARRRLSSADVWAHVQVISGSLPVLLGVVRPDQANALGPLWQALPAGFADIGTDVLVDCGRLDADPPTLPLLRAADVAVIVARPDAAGIAHVEPRLETLAHAGVAAAVVLVGERPYRASEVQAALAERGTPTDIVGGVADDRAAAKRLAGAPGSDRALGRSLLIRSARVLADTLDGRFAETVEDAEVRPDAGR